MNYSISHHKQYGITLLESLITVLIISTAFLSITRLQLGMWKTTQESQLIETANSLAFSKAIEISRLATNSETLPNNGSETEPILNTVFTTSWETQRLKSNAINIKAMVSWESKSVSFTTVKHPVDNSINSLLYTGYQY